MAIEITTAQQLSDIRLDLAGDYILANDIDLSAWGPWEPIDDFTGTFDGGGYTISNLTLDSTYFGYAIGLFRYCYGAQFRNITFDNAEAIISEGYTVAILAANADVSADGSTLSTFNNCHIKNSKLGCLEYSGPLGGDLNNSIINDCSVENTVIEIQSTGSDGYAVGGMCGIGGEATDSYVNNITFQEHPDNPADFSFEYSGGFACNISSSINCYANNVSMSFPRFENVGGFIGNNSGKKYEKCRVENLEIVSEGVSNSWGPGSGVGGFAGYAMDTFTDCYVTGSITGVKGDVGGFCGFADWEEPGGDNVFVNCYSAVSISDYGTTPESDNIGGFVGYYDTYDDVPITHENCYYDIELADNLNSYGGLRTAGEDEVYIVNPAQGKTTAEMTYPIEEVGTQIISITDTETTTQDFSEGELNKTAAKNDALQLAMIKPDPGCYYSVESSFRADDSYISEVNVTNQNSEVLIDITTTEYGEMGYKDSRDQVINCSVGDVLTVTFKGYSSYSGTQYLSWGHNLSGTLTKEADLVSGASPVTHTFNWTVPDNPGMFVLSLLLNEGSYSSMCNTTANRGERQDFTLAIDTPISYESEGYRISPKDRIPPVSSTTINELVWTEELNSQTTEISVSVDDGSTWTTVPNGGEIPNLVSEYTNEVLIKQKITTTDPSITPKILDIGYTIEGETIIREAYTGWNLTDLYNIYPSDVGNGGYPTFQEYELTEPGPRPGSLIYYKRIDVGVYPFYN